jgi:arylsulfatase A-like enzyme
MSTRQMIVKLIYMTALMVFFSTPLIASPKSSKPNFLVILADDLGYSDIGSYGGEINTPAIDELARHGVRFSNFHVSATCSPTRSMLLTGVDNHLNGLGNMKIIMADNQFGHTGYEGHLNASVETFASRLQRNGYGTYMAGKWHLGMNKSSLPTNRGFDKSVALMETGADNWESKPYLPHNKKVHYFENEAEISLPENYYSSDYYVDKLIGYLGEHDKQKPFLAYLAFQASHYPHQAPKEIISKYLSNYKDGWQQIKSKRYQRLVELGLMPPGLEALLLPSIENWDKLTEKEQRYRSKQMAVYAGMIERMDSNISRLIDYLKEQELFDNTVIFFLSDNGADNNEIDKIYPDYINSHFDTSYETLGEKGSYSNYGPSWANVSMTPLSSYKGSASEGGMRAPLIIHYPKKFKQGTITDAFSYVTDISATILNLANIKKETDSDKIPISGHSQVGVLTGEKTDVYAKTESVGYELAGSAAVFKGDFKLVRNYPPFGNKTWKLFNIKTDPVERFNLVKEQPELFKDMLSRYNNYANKVNLVEVPENYNVIKQLSKNLKRMQDEKH